MDTLTHFQLLDLVRDFQEYRRCGFRFDEALSQVVERQVPEDQVDALRDLCQSSS